MRTCLLVVLGVLLFAPTAFAQLEGGYWDPAGPAYNATATATCQREDPYDEYIYHAPLVDGIVIDAVPTDWDAYPLLEWAAPIYSVISAGVNPNVNPTSPEDYDVRFKMAWGYATPEWPVLYILAEIMDSDQAWDPEGSWNTMDVVQMSLSEHFYDFDAPVTGTGWGFEGVDAVYGYKAGRQMQVFGIEGWGIRLYQCTHIPDAPVYCLDPDQEYSIGDQAMSGDQVYMELQLQLFESYVDQIPWIVTPGETCLGFGFSAFNDYDPTTEAEGNQFSYLTWGQSDRSAGSDDLRVWMSTIGFEDTYDVLYPTAVEATTWGGIKNAF